MWCFLTPARKLQQGLAFTTHHAEECAVRTPDCPLCGGGVELSIGVSLKKPSRTQLVFCSVREVGNNFQTHCMLCFSAVSLEGFLGAVIHLPSSLTLFAAFLPRGSGHSAWQWDWAFPHRPEAWGSMTGKWDEFCPQGVWVWLGDDKKNWDCWNDPGERFYEGK